MGEWSANNHARATAVWDKLLGFYGDALLRKFGEAPPPEWVEATGMLTDAEVARGMRRIMFGAGAKGVPSLPEFVRICRLIGDDAPPEGPPQAVPVPRIEGQKFDRWDIAGNLKFWKYITHRLTESYRPWGPAWSEEHAECTRIAVRYKNAWAQDMRESTQMQPATGEIVMPSAEEQARSFADCMQRAESDIAAYRTRKAA